MTFWLILHHAMARGAILIPVTSVLRDRVRMSEPQRCCITRRTCRSDCSMQSISLVDSMISESWESRIKLRFTSVVASVCPSTTSMLA
jgi:hypothetical protein